MTKPSINTIIEQQLCTGCGACVSESKSQTVKMELNKSGFLIPSLSENEQDSVNMLRVCPFNPNPEESVADEDKIAQNFLGKTKHFDTKIGYYNETYIGYSVNHRISSSSGGIATFIFEKLLREGYVDHLFVVRDVNGSYEYQLFSDLENITQISKTRYYPVTLENLFGQIDLIQGKVAISGVACFLKAVRLKQHYYPGLRDKIPFLVGIICGGTKSSFFTDYLAQRSGIKGKYRNQEYRIKDKNNLSSDYSFSAFDEDDNNHVMRMREVGDMWGTGLFKSNACDFCSDVLTEVADISLGDAWLDEYRQDGLGNSVVITRSTKADLLIKTGIESGELNLKIVPKEAIIKSQLPSFTHRQDAIKFRIWLSKINNNIVPHIRERVLQNISLPYKIVQLQRRRTRSKSLKIWEQNKDAEIFKQEMKSDLELLKNLTKIYHKFRKVFLSL
ncbi:Coenzyme F420 hydrogenase/dehydrogenase, beta subunit C-terminal domain [Dyadobacter sp. CY345]|uniref:Coenzyme F420 hydrogenase/dehydrogenase, beta subunit C-terminal domain n=1 Tax=Dyadobacter sp. CY345 TaxID=2909335 RepID=UPI001F35F2A2|nr:Coenzyme F420 hydrogenase/dehydrogenase, beta subunit C-terminal domain [Dyadobacter sp. CY345]MCF2447046.1 Coenzyme F420 hydrogenase/dehydrogenase, beta subunit C-terminal domain [Dyadobacter sp. CY345]